MKGANKHLSRSESASALYYRYIFLCKFTKLGCLHVFYRQTFPGGEKVTYTGKEVLCAKCSHIPVKDSDTRSQASPTSLNGALTGIQKFFNTSLPNREVFHAGSP